MSEQQVDRQPESSDVGASSGDGRVPDDPSRHDSSGIGVDLPAASPFTASARSAEGVRPSDDATAEPGSSNAGDNGATDVAESPDAPDRFPEPVAPDGGTQEIVSTDTVSTDTIDTTDSTDLTDDSIDTTDAVAGGGHDAAADGESSAHEPQADEEPDAVARGWVRHDGERRDVLFVLAGPSLGIGAIEHSEPPIWVDLTTVSNLDAIGDPVDGVLEVEMQLDDAAPIAAGWPLDFVDHVVAALRDHVDAVADAEVPEAAAVDTGVVSISEEPAAAATEHDPISSAPDLGSTSFFEHTPLTTNDSTALVLEDVTYIRGYPGHPKKRRRCTATLTHDGIQVGGPTDLSFRVGWDVVSSIETQNADEARFRMNTKIHRDASALVLHCEQAVTLVLEARDCPTLPLRSAIVQLVDDLDVVVV